MFGIGKDEDINASQVESNSINDDISLPSISSKSKSDESANRLNEMGSVSSGSVADFSSTASLINEKSVSSSDKYYSYGHELPDHFSVSDASSKQPIPSNSSSDISYTSSFSSANSSLNADDASIKTSNAVDGNFRDYYGAIVQEAIRNSSTKNDKIIASFIDPTHNDGQKQNSSEAKIIDGMEALMTSVGAKDEPSPKELSRKKPPVKEIVFKNEIDKTFSEAL